MTSVAVIARLNNTLIFWNLDINLGIGPGTAMDAFLVKELTSLAISGISKPLGMTLKI